MPSGTIAATLPATGASVYRPRRPARTLLHKIMRENLETYLKGGDPAGDKQAGIFGRTAARCWALLLTRIYECLPLLCPRCGEPMRIIAFVLGPPVIELILRHIGEPTDPPAILPARSPPQGEIEFDQPAGQPEWPDMDQATDPAGDTWD